MASVKCAVVLSSWSEASELEYRFDFSEQASGFVIVGEHLSNRLGNGSEEVYFLRNFNSAEFGGERSRVQPRVFGIGPTDSLLSQFKNPLDSTPITSLGNHLERVRIYREFRTGIGSTVRHGVATTSPKDSLSDGGDNLALVLQEMDFLGVHDRFRDYLRRFCERFEDVKVRVGAGLAQAFLREDGLVEPLSAVRMSDGTLKFLCLLAALFHPTPPPLMCIEEPELGMHPDALRLIAEALVEASERIQLVITTHSEALIDALSEHPEAVLVCERDFDNSTQCKRLSATELEGWLERYTLGHLWRKGEIGGGRW